jgi:hypothetical protein
MDKGKGKGKGDVPSVFEVHPYLICNRSVKPAVARGEKGQEVRLQRLPLNLLTELYLVRENYPRDYKYCLMEDLVYTYLGGRSPKSEQERIKTEENVQKTMAKLRDNLKKIHGGEDIIEFNEAWPGYRIKPNCSLHFPHKKPGTPTAPLRF